LAKIESNGKEYEIRHRLTISQVKRSREILGAFVNMRDRIEAAKVNKDEEEKLEKDVLTKTNEQDQLMIDILADCLGLQQADFDKLEYIEGALLFSDLFKASTVIPKKSGEPYG
jgi:hypothetical protein